jgi:hypothetical protein
MKIGTLVKLKGDNDPRPMRFKVRSLKADRASCRLLRKDGKRGGCYLFKLADIEELKQ